MRTEAEAPAGFFSVGRGGTGPSSPVDRCGKRCAGRTRVGRGARGREGSPSMCPRWLARRTTRVCPSTGPAVVHSSVFAGQVPVEALVSNTCTRPRRLTVAVSCRRSRLPWASWSRGWRTVAGRFAGHLVSGSWRRSTRTGAARWLPRSVARWRSRRRQRPRPPRRPPPPRPLRPRRPPRPPRLPRPPRRVGPRQRLRCQEEPRTLPRRAMASRLLRCPPMAPRWRCRLLTVRRSVRRSARWCRLRLV